MDIPFLELGYCPEEMLYDSFEIYKDGLDIHFLYRDNAIYLIQRKKETVHQQGQDLIGQYLENLQING